MSEKLESETPVAAATTCSACPICGEPLWFYDCWECCPSCNIEIPCSLQDRIKKAKDDEWGLYAFYGRLEELKGRRVKPAQNSKHPNFTEDEHVIVSEVHPPNSVRISYLDGFSVGLRGLSELNLSSLPNAQVQARPEAVACNDGLERCNLRREK